MRRVAHQWILIETIVLMLGHTRALAEEPRSFYDAKNDAFDHLHLAGRCNGYCGTPLV